jgi:hypothetical protein
LVLYSTSPSPGQILHMLSSRFAFTCMIHGSPILRLSSAFFAIFMGLFSSASCCDPPRAPTLWYILMPTGQAIRIRASPPQAMWYFLVTISSPGPPSVRLLYQDPVLKQSIAQWLTGSPKRHGCCLPLAAASLIRVRVGGGAAPSAAAFPSRRTPWLPALGGSSLL